jgi:hypothetical protein
MYKQREEIIIYLCPATGVVDFLIMTVAALWIFLRRRAAKGSDASV